MDFSVNSLLAGFVFGVIGVYLIRRGRASAELSWIGIGITLCIYPYFISNPFLLWGVGLGLTWYAYRLGR